MFLYKNIIVSTRSGSSRLLSFVMSRPAAENCRSDITEVAGIAKKRAATLATRGNNDLLSPHQTSGSTSAATGVDKYRSNSDTSGVGVVALSPRKAIVAERLVGLDLDCWLANLAMTIATMGPNYQQQKSENTGKR